MICGNCENEVSFVVPVAKQLYDNDNMETGIANQYWCFKCLTNNGQDDESADSFIGVPSSH